MHRLEGVGTTSEVAIGKLDEQASGGRHGGRQQRMGNHGDPTLIVDGGDCIGERQPGRDAGSQADPEQVAIASGDLLADHKLDRDSLVARTSDKLSGHINAVVVGEDGDLQITREERGIDRHRHLGAGRIAAGMNVEIRVTDGWKRVHPGTSSQRLEEGVTIRRARGRTWQHRGAQPG